MSNFAAHRAKQSRDRYTKSTPKMYPLNQALGDIMFTNRFPRLHSYREY